MVSTYSTHSTHTTMKHIRNNSGFQHKSVGITQEVVESTDLHGNVPEIIKF